MTCKTDAPARAKQYIESLPFYIPGRAISAVARGYGFDESSILKLASNENPLGFSARVQKTLLELAVHPSSCYPDPDAAILKLRLGEHYGVDTAWITAGSGSSEILDMAARAFAGPGDTVVISQYAFTSYYLAATAAGATARVIPSPDYRHNLDAMLEATDDTTRLIYIANPNNPTGSFVDLIEIRRFLDAVPPHVVVVLDEAYAEYLAPPLQSSPAKLVADYANLIVARTFSKIYGLAALRIGYGIAQPALSNTLNKVRPPFNTSSYAQAAAAAAIEDQDFVAGCRRMNELGRAQLADAFGQRGLVHLPSAGNFVLVNVGDGMAVSQRLLEKAIIVRPVANYGLPAWLRITVGTADQNARLLDALRTIEL
jgi:histidinol-phosphate aminotransferase